MIGKQEFDIEEKFLSQNDLKFYPENPRIYSALNVSDGLPSQEEIEDVMTNMEHVKELGNSIKANGGLIDPLIVRDQDFIVLEGNSRLAAYRNLIKQDPIKWGMVKCKILPFDIPEKSIFTLLGQYHIIGRKDWSPYEQAGYLYRRLCSTKVDIASIAKELGLPLANAKNYVRVYSFMVEKNDLKSNHWSHYEEYLKHTGIKKYRETIDNFDDIIIGQIKEEHINNAIDVRNKLGVIAKTNSKEAKKIMKSICAGEIDIYEGYERISDTGKITNTYQTLNKFRIKIHEKDFETALMNSDTGQTLFELRKIRSKIDKIVQNLDK